MKLLMFFCSDDGSFTDQVIHPYRFLFLSDENSHRILRPVYHTLNLLFVKIVSLLHLCSFHPFPIFTYFVRKCFQE